MEAQMCRRLCAPQQGAHYTRGLAAFDRTITGLRPLQVWRRESCGRLQEAPGIDHDADGQPWRTTQVGLTAVVEGGRESGRKPDTPTIQRGDMKIRAVAVLVPLAVSMLLVPVDARRQTVPSGYVNLDGIVNRLHEIAAANPSIAQVVDVTTTYGMPATVEGRHLYALKISDTVEVDEDEPAMLIVAAHHAREISTPVIALRAAERLTEGYGTDPQITAAVDGHEIWIAPVWNPDGYSFVAHGSNSSSADYLRVQVVSAAGTATCSRSWAPATTTMQCGRRRRSI